MQPLTENVLNRTDSAVVSLSDLTCWVEGSSDRLSALLRRARSKSELLRVHRGLYCLTPRLRPQRVDPLILAQRIHGPSYISLETALWRHGWIPEAVETVTSVCAGRSVEYDSPLGRFSYTRVPQRTLYTEVLSAEGETGRFLLATGLKALADYVYAHRCEWTSSRPVIQSLRVDPASLADCDARSIDALIENYPSRRVRRFLRGLRRELAS